ncbi:MAG: glycosyltransferase family 2 protein [Ligilactobacillus salivarius]|nr:glycosyltransferase family 2 protein [Ligilactobacillus salivarius]MDY5290963.1 glycosyltransferase family 2 protein [Ligilactobacillus salivarius]
MELSIIMPVYNENLKKLQRALNSVASLIGVKYELIIVNDGSENYIDNYLKNYIHGKENIVYINKENEGVSIARNIGIKHARGKYITFVDSDDILCGNKIDSTLLNKNLDCIIYNIKNNISKLQLRKLKNEGIINKEEVLIEFLSGDTLNSACGKLYRNEIIKKNSIHFMNNMVTGEDALFVIDVFEKSNIFYYSKEDIYVYDYDIKHENYRVDNYPLSIIKDLNILYNKKITLVDGLDLTHEYKRKVLGRISNDYTKKFFNTVVSILIYDGEVDTETILNSFEDKFDIGLSRINKFRNILLKRNSVLMLKAYGYIGRIYIRFK